MKFTFHGKAAHAGMEPEKGLNAIAMAAKAIASCPSGRIDEATKSALIAEIRQELATAALTIDVLPASARVGVSAAADIFAELTNRLAATPATALATTRVSVPNHTKAWLAARAVRRRGHSN